MGSYINEEKVEGLTQVDISESSNPTTAEVAIWITEVEAEIAERRLSTHTGTDVYIDVPPTSSGGANYSASYNVRSGQLRFYEGGEGTLVPLHNIKGPIISVTSLAKNDENPDDAASWDTLTEGPAADSDFILLQSDSLGYALLCYDNQPLAGPKRLKMTYQYGYNISTDVISRWCTYGVGIMVLEARAGTSSADGLTELDGGTLGTFVPRQYDSRIRRYKAEMDRIETAHFPTDITIPHAILS